MNLHYFACTINKHLMLLYDRLNTLRLWLPQIFQAINDYLYDHQNDAETEGTNLCVMLDNVRPNLNATTEECVVVSFLI